MVPFILTFSDLLRLWPLQSHGGFCLFSYLQIEALVLVIGFFSNGMLDTLPVLILWQNQYVHCKKHQIVNLAEYNFIIKKWTEIWEQRMGQLMGVVIRGCFIMHGVYVVTDFQAPTSICISAWNWLDVGSRYISE